MVIGVCGYNSTGSSAVMALLSEYREVSLINDEVPILYLPDGVSSLEYGINNSHMYFNGDISIHRFLVFSHNLFKTNHPKCHEIIDDYIDSLIQSKWVGNSCFDDTRKEDFSGEFIHSSKNNRKMYLAINDADFIYKTQIFTNRLLNCLAPKESQIIAVNQLFSAHNTLHTMRFVAGAKAIVVNRDIRDVYILGKKKNRLRCYPYDTPENYIMYCKKHIIETKIDTSGNTLYLQYEDLIYNYNETINQIESFLSIHDHVNRNAFFNPVEAIQNTQLWLRFPELLPDITIIKDNLDALIYDFPYEIIPNGDFY